MEEPRSAIAATINDRGYNSAIAATINERRYQTMGARFPVRWVPGN